MIRREEYFKEFSFITVHCFDVMQYRRMADRLNFSVWLNFRNQTYFSGDIFVDPESFCTWNGDKWVLRQGEEIIKIRGTQQILDYLEINGEKKPDGINKI